MASWEDLVRQKGQQLNNMVGPNSGMAQGTDQATNAAMMKLAALNQAGQQAPMQQPGTMPNQNIQPQQDLAAPNAASMTPQDAESRMNSMIQAPMTMQTVQAKLKAQADQDDAAEQHANMLQDQPMTGYSDYPKQPPAKFQSLKAKIKGSPADIRESMNGPQEVTPEMEKKLGYGAEDDEDEDKNTRASTKDTGTLGGV
jgi:hypothetical protein